MAVTTASILQLTNQIRGVGGPTAIPIAEALESLVGLITASNKNTFTGTIITAKVTGGGATGSMTFVNGEVTSQVQAT